MRSTAAEANASLATNREAIVIGLGNSMRGDDAAGLEAARVLEGRLADALVVEHEREPSDLLEFWCDAGLAIVIDAVTGVAPGAIRRFDASAEALPAHLEAGSTHAFGLAATIELARALGRLPERLVVFGIGATGFELGADLSPAVAAAVEVAAGLTADELARA